MSEGEDLTRIRREFAELLKSKNLGHITVERCYDFIVITMSREEALEMMALIRKTDG